MPGFSKLLIAVSVLSLFSCTEEEPLKIPFQKEIEHLKQESEMYGFKAPDSIAKASIIALYYNLRLGTHGVLFYKDSTQKEAITMEFFPDSTVVKDRLTAKKFNEFRSVSEHSEYIVNEKSVTHIYMSGNLSMTEENPRIDTGIQQ